MNQHQVIAPGAVLGILGDGQLGKMIAIAAAQMGYKVAVLGPGGRESPAGHVAYWAKAWGANSSVSEELLDEFCTLVSVVMIEWENIPVALVERIEAKGVRVRPGSKVLAVAQDRLLEKKCAEKLGIPVPFYRNVDNPAQDASTALKDCILKTRRNGYDGKGQVRISAGDPISAAWRTLDNVPCVLEEVVDFACEVSVIVARKPTSPDSCEQFVTYGTFENIHVNGILHSTHYPPRDDSIPSMFGVEDVAIDAATQLAEALDVHGLLAVEFFVTKNGRILFNEMAPRPHNSGHLTIECCVTSQFTQYVRAACNLPFGSVEFHSHGTMHNIIGTDADKWPEYADRYPVALHLYGKGDAKPGRKMGHFTDYC